MLIKTVIAIGLLLSGPAFAKDQKTWCSEVSEWPKGMNVPKPEVYEKQVDVSNIVSQKMVKEKWNLIDKKQLSEDDLWVIIDARSKSDRTQTIAKTILITSDYKDSKKHEFTEEILVKKIGKRLKKSVPKKAKKEMKFSSISDLNKKDIKVIVFCNGPTCHRSTFAVCELNRLGFKRENINIFLDGFDGLKDAGLKFK